MTSEEKRILLIDLCPRLSYGLRVRIYNHWTDSFEDEILSVDNIGEILRDFPIEDIKPYLRPMSSMTYEEMQDAREKFFDGSDHYDIDDTGEIYADTYQPYTSIYTLSFARLSGYIDWLNEHHLDFRGLIEMELALEDLEWTYKK